MGIIYFASLATMADEKAIVWFILTWDYYEPSAQEVCGGYAKLASVAKIENA